MGTRNLTCAVVDGEYRIAQYGQWDGYPSGQGATILQFLSKQMNREIFLQKLGQCRYATDEEYKALWVKAGADPDSDTTTMDVAERFKDANPQLSRDTAADVLQFIQDAEGEVLLRDSLSFAADSLFCEWAYVVDFDKGTFEVFEGFNKAPVPEGERFHGAISDDPSPGYYPVRLVKTYQLDSLPTLDQFLADLEPQEEDDE